MTSLNFIAENDNLQLLININSYEALKILYKLISIFSEIDNEDKVMALKGCQQITAELLSLIHKFVDMHKSINPAFHKLSSFFNRLKENEWFFIISEDDVDFKMMAFISQSLYLLNRGHTEEEIEKIFKEESKLFDKNFAVLIEDYEIKMIHGKNRYVVGESNRHKRVCRFCNFSMKDGKTFRSTAHAIPEALGNKTIINNEECDECNAKFDELIERDFVNYLNVYRVLWGIKGKDGVPKLKFKNGKILDYNEDKFVIMDTANEDSNMSNSLPGKIVLEPFYTINFMNIYRCLCKIAMGIIDSQYVQYFGETIKWINKDSSIESEMKLPKVASLVDLRNFYSQPNIVFYIRKTDNVNFPYLVVELRIFSFVFVYIVPFCSKDKLKFNDQEEYDVFWSKFKHYHNLSDWSFEEFNLDSDEEVILNLILEQENGELEREADD